MGSVGAKVSNGLATRHLSKMHALMSVFRGRTRFFFHGSVVAGADERVREEAGLIDVGDQALMRGLATAVPIILTPAVG